MSGFRMGKRGVLLPFFLVIITLFLCGLVLVTYSPHKAKLQASLVSPLPVLKIQDDLKIFELREEELILKSLDGAGFGEDGFENEFKQRFLDGYSYEMEKFVFSDLFWEGSMIDENSNLDRDSFLNVLYSVDVDAEYLVLKRLGMGKRIFIDASEIGRLNFPIVLEMEFEREYLISKENGKIVVEAV